MAGGADRGGRLALALLTAVFGSLGAAGPAAAQLPFEPGDSEAIDERPALISADQVTYDENLQLVTASGNVEIAQGNRVLRADAITYNLASNVVTASGNISLLEPSGEVVFADYVELTDDLREGFIRDIRVLMTDRSRMAAARAIRVGGTRSELSKAIFSPCELCRDDPTRAPLWQLKADRVIHDQERKTIVYRDAWMEIFGVPVAYTPYFEHPDPTVRRKSGILAPTIGRSESLGLTLQVPYYWAIAPDKDLTFEPIVTTGQGVVLAGQYRQLLPQGSLDLKGSGTIADREESSGKLEKNVLRGHIDANGRFDINETWRWGFDLKRTTDDTYLRLYNFDSERTLTSRAFAEGFRGRNYLLVDNYLFQGLRSGDNNDEAPIILPMLDYRFVSEPGTAGGTYFMDVNALALHRIEGRESRRLSVIGGWQLPYIGPIGDVYKLTASIETDGYWTDDHDPDSEEVNPGGATESNLTGRVFPQLALQWRYPWISHAEDLYQVVEPVVQVVAAPNSGNPDEIPNEDSQDFEFDDTNLFSLNRFTGIDRVDPGPRVDYGLEWTLVASGGGSASAFLGQSYRFLDNDVFMSGSGLEEKLSDIVGRIDLQPNRYLDLLYRFRFDKDTLAIRRNEVDLRVGPRALSLTLGYLDINSRADEDEFFGREELRVQLRSQVTRHWSAFVSHRRDLEADDSLQTRLGVTYQDECFLLQTVAERNFFDDRDIEPEDSIFVRLVFKHLGEVRTD